MKCKKIYNEKKSRKCESIKRVNKLSRFFLIEKKRRVLTMISTRKKEETRKSLRELTLVKSPVVR